MELLPIRRNVSWQFELKESERLFAKLGITSAQVSQKPISERDQLLA